MRLSKELRSPSSTLLPFEPIMIGEYEIERQNVTIIYKPKRLAFLKFRIMAHFQRGPGYKTVEVLKDGYISHARGERHSYKKSVGMRQASTKIMQAIES